MRKLIALTLVVSSLAFAQTEPPKSQTTKPKPQNIIFGEGSDIDGEFAVPMGELYTIPDKPKFSSLIKVRTSFNDKLMASVHEL
jgi:hypothetical protein